MAPTEGRQQALDRPEALLLLLAAPFLLFPTRLPVMTLLALGLLLPLWLGRGLITGRFLPRTPFNLALVVWLLALMAGILVSADPDLTLPKATGLLLGLTLWRTLAVQVRTPAGQRRSVTLFLLFALAMILVGTLSVQWRAKLPLLDRLVAGLPAAVLRLPESQPAGVHANQLSGTILLVWPLSLALLATAWPARRAQPLLALLAAGIAVGGGGLLLLAQSRAGWLGALAGLAALFWLRRAARPDWRPVGRWLWSALGGLVCLALVLPAARWVAGQPTPGTDSPLETVAFRLEVWRYALQAIGDFPLTGVGLGAFRQVVLRLYPITTFPNPDVAHAHNVLLQVALDTGLPGLVGYVALLMIAAVAGWRWLRQAAGGQVALPAGILASLVAFHVFGLADTIAPGAKPGLLFWWLLGLLAAPGPHFARPVDSA